MHAVSGFLLERKGNIEEAAQYNDPDTGLFFMRVQFACDQLTHDDLAMQLRMFAEPFRMNAQLHRVDPFVIDVLAIELDQPFDPADRDGVVHSI